MGGDESLPNPHDRFIRHFLAEIDHVRELITWQLPAAVVDELDLTSIQPAKQSFVNKTLRENLSDLVFNVRLAHDAGEAMVVLLFEHKSAPDEMTPFQVLRYMVEISQERHRNGQPLCCVIPIIVYHGPQPWHVARSIQELIDVPAPLKPYIPQFSLPLIDLSQCSDEELRGKSIFLATMTLLKYIKRDELAEQLPGVLSLYRQLLPPATALESLEVVLRYLVNGTDRITREDLSTLVAKTLQHQGTSLMPTIAEQWLKEGMEQGIERGREQGELIGKIQAFQAVLGRETSQRDELTKLSTAELKRIVDELTSAIEENRSR
ncbi:putative transposase [Rosistilla oblonga]|uniref:Rpn family recombination-promoting nuclease/putative transposase n=1 Tax=Rosistilla oblonga TaxID=2527990 RepID=UPI001188A58E|nr:Rpn family recombination-promoting nuclease/putative transposase [Rosistilla oblonga]QDV14107.1 putative transposase [Rosistilla oblonga]